jgi:hypothetical protein
VKTKRRENGLTAARKSEGDVIAVSIKSKIKNMNAAGSDSAIPRLTIKANAAVNLTKG